MYTANEGPTHSIKVNLSIEWKDHDKSVSEKHAGSKIKHIWAEWMCFEVLIIGFHSTVFLKENLKDSDDIICVSLVFFGRLLLSDEINSPKQFWFN